MNLRRLGAVIALASVLAVSTFGGEMNTPPCPPPDPGEMNTPPCTSTQITPDDSFAPGEMNAPPATADDVVTISETAMSFLLSALPLF
jgi:hypothetical protein